MIKRMKIYALAAATLLVSASQAGAQPPGAPAYRMTFSTTTPGIRRKWGSRVPWGCNYDQNSPELGQLPPVWIHFPLS